MSDMQKLGKYEIRRELGRGAMGVVYEAYDPLIDRVVALKVIRADQLAGDTATDLVARFRREAQAAGRLTHPNIVAIYDLAEDAGTWFIAMELVHGRELKAAFEANERFATPMIARIMTQILDALEYSHRQGVVHRDIKPANIFLLADGTVKVADFGIAHVESSDLTAVGTVLGTPAYMSPEQIMGLPVDGRSDLFSAGVILYQFLTGDRPFSGSATTIMQKVLKEEPLAPSTLNVQIPPALDAVVRKALAKRPEDRYQTALEFATAMRSAMQTNAAASDGDITIHGARAAQAREALSRSSASSSGTRSRVPLFALAGAAVLVVAGTLWYVTRSAGGDAAATAAAVTPASSVNAAAPGGTASTKTPAGAATASSTASNTASNTVSSTVSSTALPPPGPGRLVISAVGLVDPSNPHYQADKALLQGDLRADSKSQLVEKALALLLERQSLNRNYDVLRERVLANSGNYIETVVQEGEPRLGKDGLMSMTTQAVVNVKAVQQSLNTMSREQRIELIRASGDPKVSVRITVRNADQPDAPPMPSPVAENILKERISKFGFRTWAENATADKGSTADFLVDGEAKVKKLSMRLAASGVTVSKYVLTSWTVKCIDRSTGEEIYYNTVLPKNAGSWASEEAALQAIGADVATQFSREFFLQHVNVSGRKVVLTLEGMPDANSEELVARELVGLPTVISMRARAARPVVVELQLGGSGSAGDLVIGDVLKPLNTKLGQTCFSVRSASGDDVAVTFDASCADKALIAKLETNPPAALYDSPVARQKAVVSNPETLRKLMI